MSMSVLTATEERGIDGFIGDYGSDRTASWLMNQEIRTENRTETKGNNIHIGARAREGGFRALCELRSSRD